MKFSAIFLALIISFSSLASDLGPQSLTCAEIYAQELQKKTEYKQRIYQRGADIYVGSLGLMVFGRVELVAAALAIGGGMSLYGSIEPNEQKVMDLQQEGSKILRKLVKKMQKKINPNITQEEVISIISSNIESGLYCQDYPKLYTARKISKHVEKILREQYPVL